MSLMILNSKIH